MKGGAAPLTFTRSTHRRPAFVLVLGASLGAAALGFDRSSSLPLTIVAVASLVTYLLVSARRRRVARARDRLIAGVGPLPQTTVVVRHFGAAGDRGPTQP